jgi:hypothetical protein
MPRFGFTATAIILLLSLGSILPLSAFTLGHESEGHHSTAHDCPFMTHAETLCPMSFFDHLSVFKLLFEILVPGTIGLAFLLGMIWVCYIYTPKLLLSVQKRIHTFWRWRQLVMVRFSYRPLQDLFAHGILHPKFFAFSNQSN